MPFDVEKVPVGRPSYQRTDEDRDVVIAMAFAGFTQERIARAMRISENTLRKHFADELQSGADRMLADVVRTLANKARAGDITACIWITKTRLGWREQPKQVEVSAADDAQAQERKRALARQVMDQMDAMTRRAHKAEQALLDRERAAI